MNWLDIVTLIAPHGRPDILEGVARNMAMLVNDYGINTEARQAMFLAQMAQECDGFRVMEEYASGKGYEGRKDLGNTQRGDGVRYKGRGIAMLTGRFNYRHYGERLGVDLEAHPDKAADPDLSCRVAGEFWADHGCNVLADRDDFRGVTIKLNGGLNGLADRQAYYKRARAAMAGMHPDTGAYPPPPQGQVRAAQQRLQELGYHIVGALDGKVGPHTIAAIAAFQAENGLEVNGKLDAATLDRLWTAAPHVIAPDRAHGQPPKDGVTEKIQDSIGGAAATGGIGGLFGLDWLLNQVEGVSGYWTRLKDALGPLHGIGSAVADAWPVLLLILGAFCAYQVWQMKRAHVEAYRQGRLT